MKKIQTVRRRASLVLTMFGVLLSARLAAADTLTLTWDFNPEVGVTGYYVYVGTQPGVYGQPIDVHNVNSYVYSGVTPGQRYYFAVAAYAGSVVSPLSTEVSGTSNDYPTIGNPGALTNRVGQAVSLQLTGGDSDGTPVSYSATGLPAGLSISSSLGRITGTPTTAGTYSVTVSANDGVLTAQQSFTWVIQNQVTNLPPSLTNPGSLSSNVGQQILLQLQGADGDGDTLTYSASGLPAGLSITANNGRIAGAPTTPNVYTVTVGVSDGHVTTSQSFTWTVSANTTNVAPVLTNPGAQTGMVGAAAVLQLLATDANGNTLTYSATGLPAGVSITASTGRIAGTPTTAASYSVTATVSDGSLTASRTFVWVIQPANVAPTLTAPGDQSGVVNSATSLQLQGSDANGDPLTYSATGLPAGLSMTPSTGRIAGTPTTVGAYPVTVTVSDGSLSAQRVFTWTVTSSILAGQASGGTTPQGNGTATGSGQVPAAIATRSASSTGIYTGSAAVTRPVTSNTTRSTSSQSTNTTSSSSSTRTGSAAVTRSVNVTPSVDAIYTGSAATTRPATSSTSSTGALTTGSTVRSVNRTPSDTNALAQTSSQAEGSADGTTPLSVLATSESRRTAVTAPTAAPTVSIETPVDRTTVVTGTPVIFAGVASDVEDGDLSSSIVWTSSLDGRIGTGKLLNHVLTNGTHTISATVTDSKGKSRSAQVTVVVVR